MECPYCGSLRLHHENREGGVVVSYTCRLCTKAFEAEGIGRLAPKKSIIKITNDQAKPRTMISVNNNNMNNINQVNDDASDVINYDEDILKKISERNCVTKKSSSNIDNVRNSKYQVNDNKSDSLNLFWKILLFLSLLSIIGRFFN